MNADPASDALHRIANDGFEILVSATTGRIVHYGAIGGENVLWNNPRATETPVVFPGWVNWGGDKVWIWPEEDWRKWSPATTHPPGDPASAPWDVAPLGLTLRMTSPVVADYGVRIVREISLAPTGSDVAISNCLEQAADAVLALPVAIWTVTQIPAAAQIIARLAPDAVAPGYAHFPGGEWQSIETSGDSIVLHRFAAPWQKIGLDADQLSAQVGAFSFTIETRGIASGHTPHRRAQVFSDPDDSAFRLPGTLPYIELEFTSPPKRLAPGETTSLTTLWSLSVAPRIAEPDRPARRAA